MKILFIDDRENEIRRLVEVSEIRPTHTVEILVFKNLEQCLSAVTALQPNLIFIGHGLSAYPITGSEVVRHLRCAGVQAKFIANSGGGRHGFDHDGVSIDESSDRNPTKIKDICEKF